MKVYTIGYEKKSINDYIEILKKANVDVLIDVRETAWSHKRDFCKAKLNNFLRETGIEYIHLKELGNPKKIRKSSIVPFEILSTYKSYLEQTNAGIKTLLDVIKGSQHDSKSICLTCFEKDHTSCHRSIIAEHIKPYVPNVTIIHL